MLVGSDTTFFMLKASTLVGNGVRSSSPRAGIFLGILGSFHAPTALEGPVNGLERPASSQFGRPGAGAFDTSVMPRSRPSKPLSASLDGTATPTASGGGE